MAQKKPKCLRCKGPLGSWAKDGICAACLMVDALKKEPKEKA